ncbi:MAG: hypothetical protein IJQ76_06315 [Prevotella sp.]|nr:hypothetical protein [Prevotella sp.]
MVQKSLSGGTEKPIWWYWSANLVVQKWLTGYCCLQPAILLARGGNTAGWRQQ